MLLHDEKPTCRRGFATLRFGTAIKPPLVAISVEASCDIALLVGMSTAFAGYGVAAG
jgi:hypothetical protein